MSLNDNLAAIKRISDFISSEGLVDDPYPGNRNNTDGARNLKCLGLDSNTVSQIFHKTAEQFFKE